MEQKETFAGVLTDFVKRCLFATVGLIICAVGLYFQIQANFGMSPWSSLNLGISMNFPISYGDASILISAIIIVVDLIMREPIGFGTIMNALIIGKFSDLCIAWGFLPAQTHLVGQTAIILIGITLNCIGTVIYMSAGLSCGPRDTLLVGIGKRCRRISIGTVNIIMLGVVFICSLVLGSPAGLGTIISVFGTGMIMDAVFYLMKFDAKAVKHQNIPDTLRMFARAMKQQNKSFQKQNG